MTLKNQHFPCEKCGICCRNIGNATFAKDMVLPNGVCKHLDEKTNLCRIYPTRPIFCNADAFYDKYLSEKMSREEFYRQNKNACRKFQGRESSFDTTELEEWVLPAIQNLKNESNSEVADKLKTLDNELTLDKMSRKDRKVYENNGIVPFERKEFSSASSLPPIMLKQMKEREWTQFEELADNPAEYETAAQHLDNYIDMMSDEKEEVCYEFFLDFSQGRNKIKSIPFAERMLSKISDTRDADKLIEIVKYFEKKHDLAKAEPFYYTLYEIFRHGEGTQRNLDKATNYLKASIFGTNTDEKRAALRELYAEKNSGLDETARIKKAYELVIADNIQFAKNDYAVYLRGRGEYTEAIHWFVADGKFFEAYEIADLKVKEKLDSTIEEFIGAGADDNKYFEALKLMRTKFESLQAIFDFDKPEKTPRTYIGIALMYTVFGLFYALFRTAKRNPLWLGAGLLISGAAFFGGWKMEHIGVGVIPLGIWILISMYLDSRRRKKFVSACELWLKLPEHPELKKRHEIFKNSEKIIGQSKNSWVFLFPVIVTLFFSFVAFAVFEAPAESKENFLAQIETERKKNEDDGKVVVPPEMKPAASEELPKAERIDSDKPTENNPAPSAEFNSSAPESVPEKKSDDETKIKSESPDELSEATNKNPLLTQTDVGKVFGNYYSAVNERRYTDAYLYLTQACKNRLGSVEDFAVGHKDTLSVEILDFQQVAASAEAMKATYKICTRDKVDDKIKVQIFEGETTLIKVGDKWLIDYLASKPLESHL